MNLKRPWNEFPQETSVWDECKKMFEEALFLLTQSLMLDILTSKEKYRKNVLEFLDKVKEPTEPKETITIEEFKNLISLVSPDRKTAFGKFIWGREEAHKKQCENLKVGDKVFFSNISKCDGEGPMIDFEIVMAKVVE